MLQQSAEDLRDVDAEGRARQRESAVLYAHQLDIRLQRRYESVDSLVIDRPN